MELRDLRPLGLVVCMMLGIYAVLLLLLQLAIIYGPLSIDDGSTIGVAALCVLGWRLITSIVFAVWLFRAGKNLAQAGFYDLEFTPASRIWWFFVPFLALYKPYQGMRELWNASHGRDSFEETNGLVAGWWACWIGTIIVSWISGAGAFALTGGDLIVGAVNAGTVITAILIVRGVSQAQIGLSGEGLSEVFA